MYLDPKVYDKLSLRQALTNYSKISLVIARQWLVWRQRRHFVGKWAKFRSSVCVNDVQLISICWRCGKLLANASMVRSPTAIARTNPTHALAANDDKFEQFQLHPWARAYFPKRILRVGGIYLLGSSNSWHWLESVRNGNPTKPDEVTCQVIPAKHFYSQ